MQSGHEVLELESRAWASPFPLNGRKFIPGLLETQYHPHGHWGHAHSCSSVLGIGFMSPGAGVGVKRLDLILPRDERQTAYSWGPV